MEEEHHKTLTFGSISYSVATFSPRLLYRWDDSPLYPNRKMRFPAN